MQERGDAKADAGKLYLQQQKGGVQEDQILPEYRFADGKDRDGRKEMWIRYISLIFARNKKGKPKSRNMKRPNAEPEQKVCYNLMGIGYKIELRRASR